MGRNKDQKEKIIAIARKKFTTYGFTKVSIDSIVKEGRISKSTVYEYFEKKNDLILAVIDQIDKELSEKLEEIVSNKQLSFCNSLSAIMEVTKNMLANIHEDFFKDLQYEEPEIYAYYEKCRAARINKFHKKLFEEGVKNGKIRSDIDMEILISVFLQLTEISVNADMLEKLGGTNQALYAAISNLFLNGALVR